MIDVNIIVNSPRFNSSGCQFLRMEENAIVCLCNHLTDFAAFYEIPLNGFSDNGA